MDDSDTTESDITTPVYTSGVDVTTPNSEIMDIFTEVVATIPKGRQPEILKFLEEFVQNAQHQPEKPLPADQAQMKDWGMETYPEYKTRMKSVDYSLWSNGKECLRQNWGLYLKEFNPKLDRDYMSQADLKHLDIKLLERLRGQYTAKELGEFLPSLPMLNQQMANQMTPEEIQDVQKKIGWIYRNLEAA